MICKYCHENTHYIDVCPIIICKICKDIGHPQWLCIKKKNNNNKSSNNVSPVNKSLNETKSLNDNKSLFDYKKVLNTKNESPSNNNSNNLSDKNLNYYIKNVNESWDNFFI
jgi:hypothetical protein